MHIKFTRHGKGCPRKAAGYLLSEKDHKGDYRPFIETLRGDAQTFVAITESLDFDYRYTSGIIAWSKDDDPTPEQINETLNEFEKHAFAGLDPTRYHMNAVLHEAQDGSKHIHVLVPRVDLETGKSLNIAPPGHEQYFDTLRDYLNEKHNWAKPDELAILNAAVSLPNHVHTQRAAAIQIDFSGKTKPEKKELITKIIEQRVLGGVINDRKGVINTLCEFGIITRQGKDTVSVKLDGDKQAIRLSGEFYKDEFNVTTYADNRARAEANQRASSSNEVDENRVKELFRQLQSATRARAEYNAERYHFTLEVVGSSDTAGLSATIEQPSCANGISPNVDSKICRDVVESSGVITASPESQYSRAGEESKAANDSSFVSIMHSIVVNHYSNSTGEVSERIKSNHKQASQFDSYAQSSITGTYRAIDAEKRFIAKAESGFSASGLTSRLETALTNLVSGIRDAGAKVFARQVSCYAKKFRHGFIDQGNSRSTDSTDLERYTNYPISIDPSPFETFYSEYQRKQHAKHKRDLREIDTIRELSERFNATIRKSNTVLNRLLSPGFVLKPRSSIETVRIFKHIYISTAKDVVYWADMQEKYFQKKDLLGSQLVSAMFEKYNALSNYRMQEKDLTQEKVEAISAIIRNDKQMIEFATKKFKTHISEADLNQLNSRFDSTERSFQKDIKTVQSQAPILEIATVQEKSIQSIEHNSSHPF